MSEYVCVKCGRMFKKSSHLKNHHNKKNVSETVLAVHHYLIAPIRVLRTPSRSHPWALASSFVRDDAAMSVAAAVFGADADEKDDYHKGIFLEQSAAAAAL